jgi:STE24 endopeptidase
MLSQWSWLLFLLTLAASAIMLEERALPKVPSVSGVHASPSETARQYFSDEEITKGRAYARGRYMLVFIRLAVTLGLFAVLTLTQLAAKIRDLSVSLADGRVWLTIAVFGLLLGLLYYAVTFPLSLYANFFREHAFGLSTQTFRSWA